MMRLNRAGKMPALGCAIAALAISQAAMADDYTPPKIYSVTPTGVNISDGSFTFTNTDIAVGQLSLERFYLGGLRDPNTKYFGPRITHNFDIYVARNTRSPVGTILPSRYAPIVHIGNTSVGVYTQARTTNAPVYYSNVDSQAGVLTMVSGAYIFTAQDGTVYNFSSTVAASGNTNSQRVASITFPDGRTQGFFYNSSGQLKQVADSTGYALIFDYNGSGLVSAACGFNLSQTYVTATSTCSGATLKTSYAYTSGLLISVTDVFGQVTAYTRSGNEIGCVTPPGYATCKISNSVSGFSVTQQTLADGSVWSINATGGEPARSPEASLGEDPTNSSTITNPAGKVSTYSFSKSSPYTATDENGRTTNYRFTGGYENEWTAYDEIPPILAEGSLLVEATFPEGNKYLAEYGGYNVITKQTWVPKPSSGLSNSVIQYGYSCPGGTLIASCTKPVWKIDPRGNQTDYAYTSFGSIQSEMAPAPTAGVARPLKLYSYVQKYAYIKNSGGSLVAAAAPVWVIDNMTMCQTAAASSTPTCDVSATQTVTAYEYGANGTANNLLPRGMVVTDVLTSASRRTCYGYDERGRKISETAPRAGLAVCS